MFSISFCLCCLNPVYKACRIKQILHHCPVTNPLGMQHKAEEIDCEQSMVPDSIADFHTLVVVCSRLCFFFFFEKVLPTSPQKYLILILTLQPFVHTLVLVYISKGNRFCLSSPPRVHIILNTTISVLYRKCKSSLRNQFS